MNVCIRTDAATVIGTGHVMRCLTLAAGLKDKGMQPFFVCREHEGHLCELIAANGFPVLRLSGAGASGDRTSGQPVHAGWLGVGWETDCRQTHQALTAPIDWLVVDHYGLDEKWESAMRPACSHIMVIDDLADRPHDCDLLLDQNYFKDRSTRYDGLLPPACHSLLGPEYALLRTEFRQARPQAIVRDGVVRRVLIFMSGADPTNETAKVLQAVERIGNSEIQYDVVVGGSNRHAKELTERFGDSDNIVFHRQVNNMAQLMVPADLAIGGGGTTTWERCFLGLPALTMIMADNQARMTQDLAEYGAVQNLGRCEDVTPDRITRALEKLLDDPPAVKAMSEKAVQLTGGADNSGVDLVIGAMLRRLQDTAKAER